MTHSWTKSPGAMLDRVWEEIADLRRLRGGYGGLVSLATVDRAGAPDLRQVVLRRADRAAGRVEVFTDASTPKVAEIRAEPRVGLLIWQARDRLQIRLRGTATILQGAATLAEWEAMSDAQRGNYGTVPPPGTPIDSGSGFRRVADPARLAILRIGLSEIDAVHLARPHDLRARYRRAEAWRGQWLAP